MNVILLLLYETQTAMRCFIAIMYANRKWYEEGATVSPFYLFYGHNSWAQTFKLHRFKDDKNTQNLCTDHLRKRVCGSQTHAVPVIITRGHTVSHSHPTVALQKIKVIIGTSHLHKHSLYSEKVENSLLQSTE